MTSGDRPPAPAPSRYVSLIVRGWPTECWRCHQPTTCILAVHERGKRESIDWLWHDDEAVLLLAAQLLTEVGDVALARTIRRRVSKAARTAYVSNGCQHCDAIQGNFPLNEDFIGWACRSGNAINDLPMLALGRLQEPSWRHMLDHRTASICGLE